MTTAATDMTTAATGPSGRIAVPRVGRAVTSSADSVPTAGGTPAADRDDGTGTTVAMDAGAARIVAVMGAAMRAAMGIKAGMSVTLIATPTAGDPGILTVGTSAMGIIGTRDAGMTATRDAETTATRGAGTTVATAPAAGISVAVTGVVTSVAMAALPTVGMTAVVHGNGMAGAMSVVTTGLRGATRAVSTPGVRTVRSAMATTHSVEGTKGAAGRSVPGVTVP